MKLALLGDIHGNDFALAAVLAAARRAGVEKLLITGDFIGYYFRPSQVIDMLEDWDVTAVRGNHEDMLSRALAEPDYLNEVDRIYGTGLRIAIDTLSMRRLQWLCALSHPASMTIEGMSILLCHGSPWDVDQYIYPDAKADLLERCAESGYDWVVMGHTHYPMVRKVGKTVLVNPGSVGQPRNRIPAAHWALLDTASQELTLMTAPYDVSPVVALAAQRHPELPYLGNVLLGKR
ncbi:MAG: YfcE family phosphodiesterase [Pseudomonadota bacterium]